MPTSPPFWLHSFLKMSLYPPTGKIKCSLSLSSYTVSYTKCLHLRPFGYIHFSKCHCTPPQGRSNAHFPLVLILFLTQNAYISALLATFISQNVTVPPTGKIKCSLSLSSYTVSYTKCLHLRPFGYIHFSKCHCTPPQGRSNAHFPLVLILFLTQNAYISALLATFISQNVTVPPHREDQMLTFP